MTGLLRLPASRRAGRRDGRPLRIAFMPMFPEDNTGSWTFCHWPHEHSAQLGIESRWLPPASAALSAWANRPGGALRPLRMAFYWYCVVLLRRLWQIALARDCDVVLIQRGLLHPKSGPFLERLMRRVGPPYALHLDDALWTLRPEAFAKRVELAALVVTGNDRVAGFAMRQGTPVAEVPYPVETELYRLSEVGEGAPSVIGWTGTTPDEYLAPIADALAEVCAAQGARFLAVGGPERPALGALDQYMDWRPWTPAVRFEALRGAVVGVLPMQDTEEHRAKEPFKLKEYMAWGLPIVASPVGHNPEVMSDGRQGFFAADHEQWVTRLTELLGDPELRERLGRSGRELVESRYDSWSLMRRLVRVLAQVAGRAPAGTQPLA